MKGQILVTDTLFVFDEHVKKFEDAGFEVVRVEKPDMSEAELVDVIKDKVGYILGGIEYVTDAAIEAATSLKAIVFTGTGFKGHIPSWELAQQKGIKIGTTPYANVYEVAEWAVAATLAMQRDLFSLGPQGSEKFHTITSLPELTVGVVGLGHIGSKYAEMFSSLGAKEVIYWNRSKKDTAYAYADKDNLFHNADIIFVALGDDAGENFIAAKELNQMKQDALLVSISHHGIINESDLHKAIQSGKIRAAIDIVKNHDTFKELPSSRWYASNSSAAYNSTGYLKRSSDMATETLINLLETGKIKTGFYNMQFVIIGLDGSDDEAPARRQAARQDHIKQGDKLLASGNLWYGAALLNDDSNMKGSMYVMDFPSEEALQSYLKAEPYIVGDVWREVTIHKSNTREPWQFNRPQEWFEERDNTRE